MRSDQAVAGRAAEPPAQVDVPHHPAEILTPNRGFFLVGFHEFPDIDTTLAFDERRIGGDHIAFAANRDELKNGRSTSNQLGTRRSTEDVMSGRRQPRK